MSVILDQKLSKGSEYGELDQNGLQRDHPPALAIKYCQYFTPLALEFNQEYLKYCSKNE